MAIGNGPSMGQGIFFLSNSLLFPSEKRRVLTRVTTRSLHFSALQCLLLVRLWFILFQQQLKPILMCTRGYRTSTNLNLWLVVVTGVQHRCSSYTGWSGKLGSCWIFNLLILLHVFYRDQ